MRPLILLAFAFSLALGACTPKGDAPARVVEDYLQALAEKDASRLSALSCADWENSAQTELDSFQAVEVRLQDVACATSGTEGDATLVTCQGSLIATYGAEDQDLDLSGRAYQVVQDGGEWLVCGGQ